jgi:hypothetical protein
MVRSQRIYVVAGASPEGNVYTNLALAKRRATTLRELLRRRIPELDSLLEESPVGVDWSGLRRAVVASDMPWKEEVIDIIDHTPEKVTKNGVTVEERKWTLGRLDGGRAWEWMYGHIFPDLRGAGVDVVREVLREVVIVPEEPTLKVDTTPVVVPQPELEPEPEIETPPTVAIEEPEVVEEPSVVKKPFYMALKTNLLYDAGLLPNIGIEFYLGRRWSANINWMYSWWWSDTAHWYWRAYGGDVELRKYFGKRASEKPLTGHHIGIYGMVVTYDYETGGRGYMGGIPGGTIFDRANYGGGIEYGYALPIGRRLNLDFGIGIGYLGGEYQEYLPIDTHYVWQATKHRNWYGPTKAEISLVWLIGRGNINERKGGKR